jgi:hypothetical protein
MLIPEIPYTEFKKLKASEIREMKSYAVISDGDILFFAIIPPINSGATIIDNIKTKAEYVGLSGNSVGVKP